LIQRILNQVAHLALRETVADAEVIVVAVAAIVVETAVVVVETAVVSVAETVAHDQSEMQRLKRMHRHL
jgi:hypothetical protein